MLRMNLVGVTTTMPAMMRESGGVVKATMYPAYAKAGTADYNSIINKPSINGVTLEGELSLEDLGILEAQASDIDAMFQEN